MPFKFKIIYAFILSFSVHNIMPEVSLAHPPAWLPLFIQKLWNAEAWKATCKSLENNDAYKLLKRKLGCTLESNIEKLVLPTSVAHELLQQGKLFIDSYNDDYNVYRLDDIKIQLKVNRFLIKENFKHFEPVQQVYLSEIDNKLAILRSKEKNISTPLFFGEDKNRVYLSQEEADELITFIEKTGYSYREVMCEDKTTHHLHDWWGLSSDDFKHTNKLEALADFARKMDPENYGKQSVLASERSILDKEGMEKLKERIFDLIKKCIYSDKTSDPGSFRECRILPFSEVVLPE
jgi:hypothetical protein